LPTVRFSIPESVDHQSARPLAEALYTYIETDPTPVVSTERLERGGISLLQILVAGSRTAEKLGKSLVIEAPSEGALARLLSTFGLEPALCGVVAGPVFGGTSASKQGN
jgi:anti-anti-sigma regulatory factor